MNILYGQNYAQSFFSLKSCLKGVPCPSFLMMLIVQEACALYTDWVLGKVNVARVLCLKMPLSYSNSVLLSGLSFNLVQIDFYHNFGEVANTYEDTDQKV